MKKKYRKNIKGSTMMEYVLIIGLVGGASILGLSSVGTGISNFFTNLSTAIAAASSNF